jgi:DsbC/DsbD-like thiol-disulfide interchange protein
VAVRAAPTFSWASSPLKKISQAKHSSFPSPFSSSPPSTPGVCVSVCVFVCVCERSCVRVKEKELLIYAGTESKPA